MHCCLFSCIYIILYHSNFCLCCFVGGNFLCPLPFAWELACTLGRHDISLWVVVCKFTMTHFQISYLQRLTALLHYLSLVSSLSLLILLSIPPTMLFLFLTTLPTPPLAAHCLSLPTLAYLFWEGGGRSCLCISSPCIIWGERERGLALPSFSCACMCVTFPCCVTFGFRFCYCWGRRLGLLFVSHDSDLCWEATHTCLPGLYHDVTFLPLPGRRGRTMYAHSVSAPYEGSLLPCACHMPPVPLPTKT